MKISLTLGPRQPLSRQMAWGCFTSNAVMPGSGSLMAGRRVGYFQMFASLLAMTLTVVFGGKFIYWFLTEWSRLQEQNMSDPFGTLSVLWRHARWSLFSIAFFGAVWFWSLVSSLLILREARLEEPEAPPRMPRR